ncbi:MAG: acyl-ACP--UDP-N-acetylglucosamine O-acyltransferase [Zetaproteobacteria bacterium]|nr:MAG: acyl-ACP--UDP-N-acetylglucosamine O-acyltransferase [Zetaproteobacteria bacterium]
MSRQIHPTAIVDARAELADDVKIGPYCIVGPKVCIGPGTELMSHVVVAGRTTIGARNRFFPFASIGQQPQDLKYHGEPSEVVIGDDNTIRENVTINLGTEGGGMVTRIGHRNLLMAYTHVAHDCCLGNEIVMANCATLAGHITVEDGAILGGLCAVHQFVRIGKFAMVGGMCGPTKDVPPFCLVSGGYQPGLSGLNLIGLRRRGFNDEVITELKRIYRILFQGSGTMAARLSQAESLIRSEQGRYLVDFVRKAERGVLMHRRGGRSRS